RQQHLRQAGAGAGGLRPPARDRGAPVPAVSGRAPLLSICAPVAGPAGRASAPTPEAGRTSISTRRTPARDGSGQVELAVLDAAHERPPLPRREDQGRAVGVLTVAHGDGTGKIGRHLDALTVVAAGGRLAPFRVLEIQGVHFFTAPLGIELGRGSRTDDFPHRSPLSGQRGEPITPGRTLRPWPRRQRPSTQPE